MDTTAEARKTTVRLAETFFSIQGEGAEQGTPMFFVRFSGCTVAQCVLHPANNGFCDTDWSFKEEVECQSVIDAIPANVHWMCITGGEPTDQPIAMATLVDLAHKRGMRVMLQTSGIRAVPDIFDWTVVSPKETIDKTIVRQGHELKLVYTGQSIDELAQWYSETRFRRYYLMPLWSRWGANEQEVVGKTLECCEAGLPWRMTLQSQKYINIR